MLRVGIVQLSVQEGKIEKNLLRIESIIKEHKDDNVDLLCFPELCISGYQFDVARKSKDEEKLIQSLAAKYQTSILAGICLHEENKMYDAAGIWDEEGTRLGIYRKIHLYDSENGFFDRGNELSVISFKGWNIGILICADLGFPEISSILRKKGCDVIFYPSAWGCGPGFDELFSNCGRIRAAENHIYTVAFNRGDGDKCYCGYSTVSNPDGTVLAFAENTKEQYIKVNLEKDKIAEIRKNIGWTNMRLETLYKELEKEED